MKPDVDRDGVGAEVRERVDRGRRSGLPGRPTFRDLVEQTSAVGHADRPAGEQRPRGGTTG